MAIAARQVRVAGGDDHFIAVQKDVIIDPKSGLAVEVEKVAVGVDLGDGNIAVRQQERVTGVILDPPRQVNKVIIS